MATTQAPPQNNKRTLISYLEGRKTDLAQTLPPHMRADVERYIRVTLNAIQDEPRLLAACQSNPKGFYLALTKAAQQGLMPDGYGGQAYLVPYRNSKQSELLKRDFYDIEYQIGYRGFVTLILRNQEKYEAVSAKEVYSNEEFDYEEGAAPRLVHKPILSKEKRGGLIAVYAVARLNGVAMDRAPFVVMGADEIYEIRKRAKGAWKNGELQGPWKTDEAEMWKKTAIRRLAKLLDISPEITREIVRDEYQEMGLTDDGGRIEVPVPRAVDERQEESQTAAETEPASQKGAEGQPKEQPTEQPKETATKITTGQMKVIHARKKNAEKSDLDLHAFILWRWGYQSLNDIPGEHVNDVLSWIDTVDSQKQIPEEFVKQATQIALQKEEAARKEKGGKKDPQQTELPRS